MIDLSDLRVDGLLAEFLDQCRAGDRDMAYTALDELRRRVYWGAPLPRDPRRSPEERTSNRERIAETERLRTEIKRLLAASVALAQCRDVLKDSMSLQPIITVERITGAIAAADAALK